MMSPSSPVLDFDFGMYEMGNNAHPGTYFNPLIFRVIIVFRKWAWRGVLVRALRY